MILYVFISSLCVFIKNHIILYGNPVGMTQNYEHIGKRSILITWEPGNTGKHVIFINCEPGNTGTRTILITCEPGNTGKQTSLMTCDP